MVLKIFYYIKYFENLFSDTKDSLTCMLKIFSLSKGEKNSEFFSSKSSMRNIYKINKLLGL